AIAVILCIIPCLLTLTIGVDVMSISSWFTPFLLLIYLILFEKEWNWKPLVFLEKKKLQYQNKRYLEFNIDINHLNKLRKEIKALEDEIKELKTQYKLV